LRAACIYDSLGSRLAAAVITLMHDKVLNMIRETLLHENSVEQFSFDFGRSVARLDLSQPREDEDYPDYSLRLTFSGVREFHGSCAAGDCLQCELLGIECSRSPDGYHAIITVGRREEPPTQTVRVIFTDLSYERE